MTPVGDTFEHHSQYVCISVTCRLHVCPVVAWLSGPPVPSQGTRTPPGGTALEHSPPGVALSSHTWTQRTQGPTVCAWVPAALPPGPPGRVTVSGPGVSCTLSSVWGDSRALRPGDSPLGDPAQRDPPISKKAHSAWPGGGI